MTQQQKIQALEQAFEVAERKEGTFIRLRQEKRDEYGPFIQKLHDGKLPNDSIYSDILYVAQHLAGYDEPERDGIYEIEAEPYNGQLMQWLAENPIAAQYMEEAAESFGNDRYDYTFFGHVSLAQAMYREALATAICEEFQDDEADDE